MHIYNFDRSIKIINLGDIHRGNKNCDHGTLDRIIKRIESDKDTYWVSTGDMLETAIKSSKSSVYEAYTPEEELDMLSDELQPIRKKCLGFVASNHQNRIRKEVGLSLDRILATKAKIPFLGISGLIKVTCGRCSYFISLHHGVGGGTSGNKLNRSKKLAQNWLGCDVYLTGHTHTFNYGQDIQTLVDRKRNKTTEIITHHVITGHFLQYKGSYAEDMGLKAKPIGSAMVSLGANNSGNQAHKKIKVEFVDS